MCARASLYVFGCVYVYVCVCEMQCSVRVCVLCGVCVCFMTIGVVNSLNFSTFKTIYVFNGVKMNNIVSLSLVIDLVVESG